MAWKIFNIETGALVRGGFEDEDSAKGWLEKKFGESADLDAYDINEMDDDEEAELESFDEDHGQTEIDNSDSEIDSDDSDDSDEEDEIEGLTEVDEDDE
jgi:hypothetical protein